MNNWFEVKVSYEKTHENGVQKKVTEPYLIDALSHAEAEARGIEEIRPFVNGTLDVVSVRRMKIAELFFNDAGDRYYKGKIQYSTLDEKSGVEKKTTVQMLAQASNIKEALAVIGKGMEGTMADYEIVGLNETVIMDVFPYSEEDKRTVVLEGK